MTEEHKELFAYTSGPKNAKIAIVGEAWGEQEEKVKVPFIGSSGQELTRMLAQGGIPRASCFMTNVFNLRPRDNKIEYLCGKKAEVGADYKHAPLSQGKYILPQYLPHLDRLKAQLEALRPNLVLALGATSCWALLGKAGISSLRGTISPSSLIPGQKVLPTYHPAAILRNWSLRTIVIADLLKAQREAQFPEIVRPKREILIAPSLSEIAQWAGQHHEALAVDIETRHGQVTCVGFARSPSDAIVIPFVDHRAPGWNYWANPSDEAAAWVWVRRLLDHPAPKIFQNGLYDLQWLCKLGFRPRNVKFDTMLIHHTLYPEMQKSLGFLGSIYTNEMAWKLMRNQDTDKRDE
jgi:uracil-DNA glycosylase